MKMIAAVGALILVLVLFEMIRETRTFRITHYTVETKKLDHNMTEKKIAVLSDLHNCSYGRENSRLLEAIRRENPDLILAAGDMLIGDKEIPYTKAESFMKQIVKIAPVYYGNGNHEQRMKEEPQCYGTAYREYKKQLQKAGVVFLENTSVSLGWENGTARITGLEIPLSYYKKFVTKKVTIEEIRERIGKSSDEAFQILIAHNPYHAEAYSEWGADLVLSGHMHGGIVRLPFLGGCISPQAVLFPQYSGGCYDVGNTKLVVSRGLGTHTIPIRFLNEPELVMIHIRGK